MNGTKGIVTVVLFSSMFLIGCSGSDSGFEEATLPVVPDIKPSDPVNIGNLRVVSVNNVFSDSSSLTITSKYDEDGLIVEQNQVESDGSALKVILKYTPGRQLFSKEIDKGTADGQVDEIYRYTYSMSGQTSGQMIARVGDENNDGINNSRRIYGPDSAEYPTQYTESTLNADGSTTVASTATFTYLEDRVSTIEFDDDGQTGVDVRHEFQYKEDGSVDTVTITDLNGGKSGVATYTYEEGICDRTWMNNTFTSFCI